MKIKHPACRCTTKPIRRIVLAAIAMFDGLNWLRWQWPGNDEEKEKAYQKERTTFLKQWFKEWKAKMQVL